MVIDHASDNIRVNCVCPGPVETPLLRGILASAKDPKKERTHIIKSIPLRRIAKPEEIANVILFSSSDESSFMTGSVLAVDGGWSARQIISLKLKHFPQEKHLSPIMRILIPSEPWAVLLPIKIQSDSIQYEI